MPRFNAGQRDKIIMDRKRVVDLEGVWYTKHLIRAVKTVQRNASKNGDSMYTSLYRIYFQFVNSSKCNELFVF